MNLIVDLVFSNAVEEKLKNKFNPVSIVEVEEALSIFDGKLIEDKRLKNKTIPPTFWFLSETYSGRLLKIVIKLDKKNAVAYLRTAYDPDESEVIFYEDNC